MKINKFSKFVDETFNIEEIPEQVIEKDQFEDQFEAQQELDAQTIGKKGPSYTAEVLSLASKPFGKMLASSYVASGSVGWIEHNGIIYEVIVSPAAYGNFFEYFKSLRKRKMEPIESIEPTEPIEPTDQLKI